MAEVGGQTTQGDDDFGSELAQLRPQLMALSYQLLGSPVDADDAVQETFLRSWRSRDTFDPHRGSLRGWAATIATRVCFDMLTQRARRPLPHDLSEARLDPGQPLVPSLDVAWLQPLPSNWLGDDATDPAGVALRRGDLRIATTALLQTLPPRQRAVFVLRDLLSYSAAEAAAVLGVSTMAANSALQRARARIGQARGGLEGAPSEVEIDLVQAYALALERADVAALVRLVTDDVRFEMPPVAAWSNDVASYAAFMARLFEGRGRRWTTRLCSANGQPALLLYRVTDAGPQPHTLQVFSGGPTGLRHVLVYADARLFTLFEQSLGPD